MTLRALHRPALISLAIACTAAGWWGCSATTNDKVFAETTGTGTTTTTGNGGSGQGGSGTTSGEGGDITIDAGDPDATLDDGGACAATSAEAELIPLDMVILLDKSGSMSGSKWTGVTNALKTFILDPASAGIGVGLVYFPVDLANDCNFLDYQNLAVPLGELPGNAQPLIDSINVTSPNGGTPTYGALKGALFATTAYQDANPTHKVILVLATDGDPTSCAETSIPPIAALAQSALNYNGVQTYVIAVQGSTLANLNQIAVAGGTSQAYDVTQNVAQFSQKMAEIRAAALSCEFTMPPPPDNEQLDPAKVNVSYTPGGQGNAQTLPHADNLGDCGGQAGWYYDNNADPTKIKLCPASCATVQADSQAAISVLFGCKTEIN